MKMCEVVGARFTTVVARKVTIVPIQPAVRLSSNSPINMVMVRTTRGNAEQHLLYLPFIYFYFPWRIYGDLWRRVGRREPAEIGATVN